MPRVSKKTPTHHQIYNYLDYRVFLKDLVKAFKAKRKDFTMRNFAQEAGFGSPSYLKMIIDGQRNLTNSSMEKLAQALLISGREKEYFETLVHYNQSKKPDEKSKLFEELNRIRPRKALSEVEKSQVKFLTKDYYSCIREMVLLDDFKEDAKWIAARCLPRISPAEARDALDTLLKLNLIKRNENGKLIQSEPIVGTQAQTDVVESFNYHETVLNKARHVLSQTKQEDRHYEAVTIPITTGLSKEITQKITKLIEEVLDEVNTEGHDFNEVYQLSIQFFPATTKEHLSPYNTPDDEEEE